jgi:hypothetical protein
MWCVRPGVAISKRFPFDYHDQFNTINLSSSKKRVLTFLYARSIASAPLSTCSTVEIKVPMNLQNDLQITTNSERGFCFCTDLSTPGPCDCTCSLTDAIERLARNKSTSELLFTGFSMITLNNMMDGVWSLGLSECKLGTSTQDGGYLHRLCTVNNECKLSEPKQNKTTAPLSILAQTKSNKYNRMHAVTASSSSLRTLPPDRISRFPPVPRRSTAWSGLAWPDRTLSPSMILPIKSQHTRLVPAAYDGRQLDTQQGGRKQSHSPCASQPSLDCLVGGPDTPHCCLAKRWGGRM